MESSTKILRRLLDERGVEHEGDERSVRWRDHNGVMMQAFPLANGEMGMEVWSCTPEQAIAATLGTGTCTDTGRYCFTCSECGWTANEPHHAFGGFWPTYCPSCGKRVVA